jgi:dethiobiotin synthetase
VLSLLVTGTGTGIGKTVVTAAAAALSISRRERCTVLKPAQTGVTDGAPGDLADVVRLAGEQVRTVELARYPDPLSPAAAARRAGLPTLEPASVAGAVVAAQQDSDLVLVEGAGGLLVRFDDAGYTLADLALELRLPVLLVVQAGLGTLNATSTTLEVMLHRGLDLAGLVVGSWPQEPGLAERSNLADLEAISGRPLLGVLPGGLGRLDRAGFLAQARAGLAPALGGTFDAELFRSVHA